MKKNFTWNDNDDDNSNNNKSATFHKTNNFFLNKKIYVNNIAPLTEMNSKSILSPNDYSIRWLKMSMEYALLYRINIDVNTFPHPSCNCHLSDIHFYCKPPKSILIHFLNEQQICKENLNEMKWVHQFNLNFAQPIQPGFDHEYFFFIISTMATSFRVCKWFIRIAKRTESDL